MRGALRLQDRDAPLEVDLGDTLEPSDSEDEMEAESDLDNGDEEITSEGEDA